MDVEKLARKLEPLIPDEVGHWLRVRDLADPDIKDLVEKELISAAYTHLGDFTEWILLYELDVRKIRKLLVAGEEFHAVAFRVDVSDAVSVG